MKIDVEAIVRYAGEKGRVNQNELSLLRNVLTYCAGIPGDVVKHMHMLSEMLKGIFNDAEMEKIINGEAPTMLVYPVRVYVKRCYTTFVKVPMGTELCGIRSKAAAKICQKNNDGKDIGDGLEEISLGDIIEIRVDEEGVQEE